MDARKKLAALLAYPRSNGHAELWVRFHQLRSYVQDSQPHEKKEWAEFELLLKFVLGK